MDDDPIDLYKGALVISTGLMDNCGFSYGAIFLADNISATSAGVQTVRHEYGHTLQLEEMGILSYTTFVVAPSIVCYWLDEAGSLDAHYYSLPWEYEADIYGGVKGRAGYSSSVKQSYFLYKFFVSYFSGNGMAEQYANRLNS